jgi:short subunit fatty acids transporter
MLHKDSDSLFHSDLVIFALPVALGFIGFFKVLSSWATSEKKPAIRILLNSIISLILCVLSWGLFQMIAFNIYGS